MNSARVPPATFACWKRDWWATFPERPIYETINAIRTLHQAAGDPDDWQSPHERGASADVRAAYELEQFEWSVAYVRGVVKGMN